jgi:hypothetical protein
MIRQNSDERKRTHDQHEQRPFGRIEWDACRLRIDPDVDWCRIGASGESLTQPGIQPRARPRFVAARAETSHDEKRRGTAVGPRIGDRECASQAHHLAVDAMETLTR